jgi:hypothetical protein
MLVLIRIATGGKDKAYGCNGLEYFKLKIYDLSKLKIIKYQRTKQIFVKILKKSINSMVLSLNL